MENNNKPKYKSKKVKKNYSRFSIVEEYLNKEFDLRRNQVSGIIECRRKNESNYEPLNEDNIYRELQHQNISFSLNNLMSLLRSGFVPTYDPLATYFNSLPEWDEKTDYVMQLCDFIKVKDQERFNRHFKKMFARCIACAIGDAFNKQAFILMGGQSSGKTTFLRWLCPKELSSYYTENISTDKDSLISLTENFIINLDEMAAMQKIELNGFKSMLSKDTVKIRWPYDKRPKIAKRRANFFGSTNKDEFLNDETGSVRWLCFQVESINWDYKSNIDINLIWAQAFSLFKSGFNYELSSEEISENENVNANHQVTTAEMELLQKYFKPTTKGLPLAEPYTATDIINKFKSEGINLNLSVTNIGRALKLLGIPRVSERVGEAKVSKKVYWLEFIPPTTNN